MLKKKNYYLKHVLHFITYFEILKPFNNIILKSKLISYFKLELFLNADWLFCILYVLKNNSITRLQHCLDIIVVDQPKSKRFVVTYLLLSLFSHKIKITTKIGQLQSILTISSLFSTAVWLEREIFDLFGIYFLFNTDLRNILTDYGFQGFPLRKTFPVSGYIELFYDDINKSIISKQVEFSQQYKNFFFKTLW